MNLNNSEDFSEILRKNTKKIPLSKGRMEIIIKYAIENVDVLHFLINFKFYFLISLLKM